MARKGLLNPSMLDEQKSLKKAFVDTKNSSIPQGKNFYSLSMQKFITNMNDD
jgi:hypothetical protein